MIVIRCPCGHWVQRGKRDAPSPLDSYKKHTEFLLRTHTCRDLERGTTAWSLYTIFKKWMVVYDDVRKLEDCLNPFCTIRQFSALLRKYLHCYRKYMHTYLWVKNLSWNVHYLVWSWIMLIIKEMLPVKMGRIGGFVPLFECLADRYTVALIISLAANKHSKNKLILIFK